MASLDDLKQWIDRDLKPGRWSVEVVRDDDRELAYWITGRRYEFTVSASLRDDYLGCICRTRPPKRGKSHPGFADLADGRLTEQTWQAILADMQRMEVEPYRGPGL